MRWKIIVFLLLVLGLLAAVSSYAQYTGFDLENRKSATLFPTKGPGDEAIVTELRETNRLLQQQNRLLEEQNRLLRTHLTRPAK
jgi:hypothetical protein